MQQYSTDSFHVDNGIRTLKAEKIYFFKPGNGFNANDNNEVKQFNWLIIEIQAIKAK